jgi:hypothetical protein
MAAEIVILSGSRQGERLVLESEQFRAGDEPACEIYFNPALDPGARGRVVLFRHREDGWNVLPLGSPGLLLDYDPLGDATTIRSGQVVRMSADGPDFSFRVVKTAEAPQTPATPPMPPVKPSPVVPSAPVDLLQVLSAAASGPAILRAPPEPPPTPLGRRPLFLAGIAAGVMALAFVLTLGWWAFQPAGEEETAHGVEPPLAQAETARAGNTSVPDITPPQPPQVESPAPPPSKPAGPAADPLGTAKQALYLLQIEQRMPDNSTVVYPYATCCAVSRRELLTTANVGCELLRSRARKYKIYATRPEEPAKLTVTEIRIHRDFLAHETDRQRRRYCDLALLAVDGQLPVSAAVAGRADLVPPALEEGVRLTLAGYPHDGQKLTVHDRLALQAFEGKVFVIRALAPQASDTSLCLDLIAPLPENAFGFGVFTRTGKLLGIYNEPPDETEARGMKNLHIVTTVHPEQIERGLRERDEKLWVEPRVRDVPAKEVQL